MRKPIAVAPLVAMLLTLAGPAPRALAASPPAARASVLDIVLPGAAGDALAFARSSARGGSQPVSSASPITLLGQDPRAATATPAAPDASKALKDYVDPTSSMTFQAGFAEAHVTGDGANARAGFGAGSGSGFALANKFFTFDQQAQMLSTWQQVNDRIAEALNTALAPVGGLLGNAGITLPDLTGIPATGLVDVMSARGVASSSSASLSPGFSSARADATAGQLVLFDGFIKVDDITAKAVSESIAGADTRTASATYGRLSIAGLDVVIEGDHIALAGNDLLSRATLAPLLDTVLGTMKTLGVDIHAGDTVIDGTTRSVSALSIAVPAAGLAITVGAASAGAPTVAAVLGESVHNPPLPPVVEPPVSVRVPVVTEPIPLAQAPGTTTTIIGPIDRRLGPRAARALALAFLIILGGALFATAGPLAFVRRHVRRIRSEGGLP